MGLIGEQVTHKLCTLSNVDDNLSEIVDIKLTSVVNDSHVTCTAYVIDTIPITCPAVDVSEYPHLQDLPLAEVLVPLEIRRG